MKQLTVSNSYKTNDEKALKKAVTKKMEKIINSVIKKQIKGK